MSRLNILSLFCIALMAATALAPPAQAQRDGQRSEDGPRRGGRGGPGGPGGFNRGQSLVGLLRIDAVRNEIKLTQEQQELVQILGEELREGRPDFPQNFREMSEEERNEFREKMEKWNADQAAQAKETLKTILEAPQFTRLQEISIQTQGVNALLDAEIAQTLKLTPEQTAKLKETQEAIGEEMRSAMREAFQGGGGFDRDAMRERMQTFRKESEEKMLANLTPEQKTAFEGLKGAPFEMPEDAFSFGRRGRGGNRGEGRPNSGRPPRPE